MHVLGLSCHYHDAAACLVSDGRVVAAAQEERFDRRKNSPDLPIHAVNACLQIGEVTLDDLDAVAFYEKPFLKLERVILSHLRAYPRSRQTFVRTLPPWLDDRLVLPLALRRELGYRGPVYFLKHHLSHSASSFLASPFERAAVLTADGVGEWATTTTGTGEGTRIELDRELRFPDSLGLLYTAVTTYLGFRALSGEGKVMALADYGEPAYRDRFREIVQVADDGAIHVDPEYFGFLEGGRMYSDRFVETFGPAREPEGELTDHHRDMAATLQRTLEDAVLAMARSLQERTGMTRLCLAGGVFLNVSVNSRVLRETPFEELFIQPAAGDAGGALGAALQAYHSLSGDEERQPPEDTFLGPDYPMSRIRRVVRTGGAPFEELEPGELAEKVAERLERGQIVGRFEGRMEFGPRALGHRSILASPCDPGMRDRLNREIKHRELFRPYGVSVLRERVGEFFDFDGDSPYMLLVAPARPDLAGRIPSALHVNGTSRLQTVTAEGDAPYHAILDAFRRRTGVPMVINTSFNDRGEPIVCTPEDAYDCFRRTGLDALAIGPFLVDGGGG